MHEVPTVSNPGRSRESRLSILSSSSESEEDPLFNFDYNTMFREAAADPDSRGNIQLAASSQSEESEDDSESSSSSEEDVDVPPRFHWSNAANGNPFTGRRVITRGLSGPFSGSSTTFSTVVPQE